MCLITLVCVYHNFYDALLLTAPCLALATRRLGRHMAAWRRGLLAVLILIPFVNYASTRSFLAKFDLEAPARRCSRRQIAWRCGWPWGLRQIGAYVAASSPRRTLADVETPDREASSVALGQIVTPSSQAVAAAGKLKRPREHA